MLMVDPTSPRVSVVTATHNGARFLAAAIQSILGQSYSDFEYVIVDDVSTDASAAILAGFAAHDSRVRVVTNSVQLGPAGALNRALAAAQGSYVAVLDHDDLALPERLARQVAFLDAHPEVGAVGAQARIIDEGSATINHQAYPTHPAVVRWQLLFGASLLHSASMYRRVLVQQLGGYSEDHPYLCDYELLGRMAEISQITNLPEELACYRRSQTQVMSQHPIGDRLVELAAPVGNGEAGEGKMARWGHHEGRQLTMSRAAVGNQARAIHVVEKPAQAHLAIQVGADLRGLHGTHGFR